MSQRYVFKFFGSVGPGGAFSSLTEQICTSIFPMAYKVGDEESVETEIDKQLNQVREEFIKPLISSTQTCLFSQIHRNEYTRVLFEFINDIFQIKNKFERGVASGNDDQKENAFKVLHDILKKYIEKMVRLEKNKYMRERVYYQKQNEIAMYEQANKAYLNVRKDVVDNLTKQAKTICKPTPEDFKRYIPEMYEEAFDAMNDKDVELAEQDVRNFYDMWIQIKSKYQSEYNRLLELRNVGGATEEDQVKMDKMLDATKDEQDQQQYDLLFIESGEDVEDLFLAFRVYKLERD